MSAELPILVNSFSGGRTSAVMTKLSNEQHASTHRIINIFANTGQEHPNTLEFVHACDKAFGWNLVWVEAVVNPIYRKGITSVVVNYETACRDGSIFEDLCEKYGLPMQGYSNCTRDLKERPIRHYLKSIGLKRKDYWITIGIRADEMDRISVNRIKNRWIYPLADAGWTKGDVKAECVKWDFDLDLKGEHYGNCVWCWKKSLRKLMTIAKEDPSQFRLPMKLDLKYRFNGAQKVVDGKAIHPNGRRMFREMRSTGDIIHLARTLDFTPYEDDESQAQMFSTADYDLFLDTGSACGESCEIGADD